LFLCNIQETITISKKEYDALRRENVELKQQLREALSLIRDLQIEIQLLKNGRKSNTSSTPSSQDFTRSNIKNSREKSDRKPGGQKGHKGSSLKMSETPDKIIEHKPDYCSGCGEGLDGSLSQLHKRRQEIIIPPIVPEYIEHQSYQCICGKCGNETTGRMPSHLKANIQYGKNVQALVTYLSIYQYLPANRLKKFLQDVVGLPMSEGTIFNILGSMSDKAQPIYQTIKEKIQSSKFVGGDETGVHINKSKAWFWVFQNNTLTFILASFSRGYQTIINTFSNGFPMSVYVSDSLPAQLKVRSLAKQLCFAHLMRELKNFEETFNSKWAGELKQLFKNAIGYKKQMSENDYSGSNIKVKEFEQELSTLLETDTLNKHKKEKAFIKRLIKNRNSIFTFLYHKEVPADNNGSERSIRNLKVKMKVSNQFKSFEFAQHYAVIRSVIDTTIKNSMNVFDALVNLANQDLVPTE